LSETKKSVRKVSVHFEYLEKGSRGLDVTWQYTVHKVSQWLTADWLSPRESDSSRMRSKFSSDRMPSYIKVMQPVLEIFKMDGYLSDKSRIGWLSVQTIVRKFIILHFE